MDKRAAAYFKKRDANLPWRGEIYDTLLLISHWSEGDGDCPGVWRDRAPGHRCLTSVQWSTSSWGLLSGNRLVSVEALSVPQLVAEAVDVVYRKEHSARDLAPFVLDYLSDEIKNPEFWLTGLMAALQTSRGLYPEYVFLHDLAPLSADGQRQGMSGRLMNLRIRPSWGDRATVLQELGGPKVRL